MTDPDSEPFTPEEWAKIEPRRDEALVALARHAKRQFYFYGAFTIVYFLLFTWTSWLFVMASGSWWNPLLDLVLCAFFGWQASRQLRALAGFEERRRRPIRLPD